MSRRPDACIRMDGTALREPDTGLQRFHYVVHVSLSTTTQEAAASRRLNKPEPFHSSVYIQREIRLTPCTTSQTLVQGQNTRSTPAQTLTLVINN